MPTVLRTGPYRCFYYAGDRGFYYAGDREEPPLIHVERDVNVAKFWLDPVRLANSGGFRRHEIGRIQRLAEEHRDDLLRSWDEFFND
jgi:uncharacterized protein DUF4160